MQIMYSIKLRNARLRRSGMSGSIERMFSIIRFVMISRVSWSLDLLAMDFDFAERAGRESFARMSWARMVSASASVFEIRLIYCALR